MHLGFQWMYLLPWLSWQSSSSQTEGEKKTEEIDAKGMRYLKMALMPLVAYSAGYSLYSYEYKSWWSWLISSLANACYTFGVSTKCIFLIPLGEVLTYFFI